MKFIAGLLSTVVGVLTMIEGQFSRLGIPEQTLSGSNARIAGVLFTLWGLAVLRECWKERKLNNKPK